MDSGCGAPVVSAAVLEKVNNIVCQSKQYEVGGIGGINKAKEFAKFDVYMHIKKDN